MIKKNIVANVVGKSWSMLMGLLFVPLYIKFLGIESYGLIGFFVTLQMVFAVLDVGMSTTLNRELARASAHPGNAKRTRNLVRTLEVIYWVIAGFIGTTIIIIGPWIARNWLNTYELPISTIENAVMILGLVISLQLPIGFYTGGLQGLQRQVMSNVIISSIATFRGVGAVLILWLISPTIEAYFLWQLVISMLGVAWSAIILWRSLPQDPGSVKFRIGLFRSIWKFTAGMTGIAIMGMLVFQADKIILSALLPLNEFGYYTLAGTVAMASVFAAGPIYTAVFPMFSQLVSAGEHKQLKILYHCFSQLASVALLPLALLVIFFSFELLTLWTGDPMVAEHTHWLVSILIIGHVLNGLILIPYALQLAHGWTNLTFYANVVAVFFLLPFIFILATHYGAIGAAFVWVLFNIGYVAVVMPLMHRRLLRGEMGYWYKVDVGRPLVVSLAIIVLARILYPHSTSSFGVVIFLGIVYLSTMIAAVLVAPHIRIRIIKYFSNIKSCKNAQRAVE